MGGDLTTRSLCVALGVYAVATARTRPGKGWWARRVIVEQRLAERLATDTDVAGYLADAYSGTRDWKIVRGWKFASGVWESCWEHAP